MKEKGPRIMLRNLKVVTISCDEKGVRFIPTVSQVKQQRDCYASCADVNFTGKNW